jgi:hypothetical protein
MNEHKIQRETQGNRKTVLALQGEKHVAAVIK